MSLIFGPSHIALAQKSFSSTVSEGAVYRIPNKNGDGQWAQLAAVVDGPAQAQRLAMAEMSRALAILSSRSKAVVARARKK